MIISNAQERLKKIKDIIFLFIRSNDQKRQPYDNFGFLLGLGTLKATIHREVPLVS